MGDLYKWTKEDDANFLAGYLQKYYICKTELWNKNTKKVPFREYSKERFKKSNAKNSSEPSLLRALSFCFGWKYLLLSIIILVQECGVKYVQWNFFITFTFIEINWNNSLCRVLQCFCIGWFIGSFSDNVSEQPFLVWYTELNYYQGMSWNAKS